MDSKLTDFWSFKCSLHDWEQLRSTLVFVFDAVLPAGSVDGVVERQSEYSAWLLRKGEVDVEVDGHHYTGTSGSWLICFANTVRQKYTPDAHLLSLRMTCSWHDGQPLFTGKKVVQFEASKYPHLEQIALHLREDVADVTSRPEDPSFTFLRRSRMKYGEFMRHKMHLLEWNQALAEILQAEHLELSIPQAIDPRLELALHEIDRSALNASFPGQRLCRVSGLTVGQLNRLSTRSLGQTLYAYWENRRLQRAKDLLRETAISIKEIAYRFGFRHASHFSTWFKRYTGQSPKEFSKPVAKVDE